VAQVNHNSYSDPHIRSILDSVKTVAIVGASHKDVRPSYFVARYLLDKGYRVIPVNPGLGGQTILGQSVYGHLRDIPEPVDMVDIFRSSNVAPIIVAEALAMSPRPKVIWMQLGVRNDEAAATAESAGLTVVMNRCPKIEYGRLSGEIGWMGVNSRVLSSKKPIMSGQAQGWGLSAKAQGPRK
jgi:predicted CoA-binding protein